jgi:hypothetical protein
MGRKRENDFGILFKHIPNLAKAWNAENVSNYPMMNILRNYLVIKTVWAGHSWGAHYILLAHIF